MSDPTPVGNEDPGPAAAKPRRELAATLVLGLLAGATVSFAVARPWAARTVGVPGLPTAEVSVTGGDVAPLVSALGAVILAGTVVTLATRGLLRRVCGVVVATAGGAVVLATVTAEPALAAQLHDQVVGAAGAAASSALGPTATPWRWLCLLGGAAAALFGALVAWRGPTWPAMGSRYDAPSAKSRSRDSATDTDQWRALDRGEDPTDTRAR